MITVGDDFRFAFVSSCLEGEFVCACASLLVFGAFMKGIFNASVLLRYARSKLDRLLRYAAFFNRLRCPPDLPAFLVAGRRLVETREMAKLLPDMAPC